MESAKPQHRILTVVEGRKANKKVIEDYKKAAKQRGWGFANIAELNSDKLARFDLAKVPLEYVVFRDLTANNYAETERLLEYLRQNNKIGINLNANGARAATSDKHYQQGLFLLDPLLKEYALPTFEAKSKNNVMSYIKGGRVSFPIVLKYRWGTAGDKITLIKNESDLDKIKDFEHLLIEQYIEAEHDWRVFVMGGTPIGIMRKTGDKDHPGDFKTWSAGRIKAIEEDQDIIEELGRIACRAAAVSKLEYTGVDIIQDKHTKKYYILETNFAAGWMNFIPVTGISIPDRVIDWIEDRDYARHHSISQTVKQYIKKREKYLPRRTIILYESILNGQKGIIKDCKKHFSRYNTRYLHESGTIFKKLSKAYQELVEGADGKDYQTLISEIEQMPLSWAGNFIGPEVGTLEDGAILSALYLYTLGKTRKV